LVPAFGGSNPSALAKHKHHKDFFGSLFVFCYNTTMHTEPVDTKGPDTEREVLDAMANFYREA
jgi:hypothetical protein